MPTDLELESELKAVATQFTKDERNQEYRLIVNENSYVKFFPIIKKYGMAFVVRSSDDYRKNDRRRLSWSTSNVPYSGTPFMVEKCSILQCVNGPKYYKTGSNNNTIMPQGDPPVGKRKRSRKQPSKKVDCKATMKVICVKTYPEFSIKGVKNIKDEKADIMKVLKEKDAASVIIKTVYHISFNTLSLHCHSIFSSESLFSVNEFNSGNGGILSAVSSPEKSLDLIKNSVSASTIRELIKNIYDRSHFLNPNCTDLNLYNKLQDVINIMENFIDYNENVLALPISNCRTHCVSDQPQLKKCKKK